MKALAGPRRESWVLGKILEVPLPLENEAVWVGMEEEMGRGGEEREADWEESDWYFWSGGGGGCCKYRLEQRKDSYFWMTGFYIV